MATNQGDRQASVRAVTGTRWTYEGDWHALFDLAGIPAWDFNGRMLAWINTRLGTSYQNINDAMAAFAINQGYTSWGAMGTFDAAGVIDPATLFASSELGGYWTTSDPVSMRQALDGFASGQIAASVGWIIDKKNIGSGRLDTAIAAMTELLTAGDFTSGSAGWTPGTGWTFASGKATNDGSSNSLVSVATVYQLGKVYRTKVTVTDQTVNSLGIYVASGAQNISTIPSPAVPITFPTDFEYYTKVTAAGTGKLQLAPFGFTGSIDDVSVKEVVGNHAMASADGVRPTLQLATSGGREYYVLNFDGVDDLLTTSFASSLGSNCTVVVGTASGVTFLTGQTIGSGSYSLPTSNWYSCLVINRALTAQERTRLEQTFIQQGRTIVTGSLIWQDDFTTLDMTTSSHVGAWRPNDYSQNVNVGYKDYSGESWNINPNQHPANTPFSVSSGILAINAVRTPAGIVPDIESVLGSGNAPAWSGGVLITNKDVRTFYRGYIEIRARFPNIGKGMFPGIWLYCSENGAYVTKGASEIDLLEIFGYAAATPFESTYHIKNQLGIGRTYNLGQTTLPSPTSFHLFAVDWQADYIRYYLDGTLIKSVIGPDAEWFTVPMGVRLNMSMDATWFAAGNKSDGTTPAAVTMEVDYVKYWDQKP